MNDSATMYVKEAIRDAIEYIERELPDEAPTIRRSLYKSLALLAGRSDQSAESYADTAMNWEK